MRNRIYSMNRSIFNVIATTSSPSLDVWWQGNDIIYDYDNPYAVKRGSCIGLADSKGFVLQISGLSFDELWADLRNIHLPVWHAFVPGLKVLVTQVAAHLPSSNSTEANLMSMNKEVFFALPAGSVVASSYVSSAGVPVFALVLQSGNDRVNQWKKIREHRLRTAECAVFESAMEYLSWQAAMHAHREQTRSTGDRQ